MNKNYSPIEYIKNIERDFTNEMLNDTLRYQKQYDFDIGKNNVAWNNEADAFRHTYMQSILSLRYTPLIAKRVSEEHEEQGEKRGQDPREANMDLWNNQQGQQIYNEICKEYPNFRQLPEQQQKDIVAKKVVQRMKAGQLITNPNDKRQYKNNNIIPTRSIGGVQNNGRALGYAAPIENLDHIFTPSEIGNMTPEEFSQNEQAIMQQLKDGLINNTSEQKDFSGYKNEVTGSSQIFSREDIGAMSKEEYAKNEKAIQSQLNTIGIPTNEELQNASQNGGGTVYVKPYKRTDGTEVRGYYRSR